MWLRDFWKTLEMIMEFKVGDKLVIFKIYPSLWKKAWEFLVEGNEIFRFSFINGKHYHHSLDNILK